MASDRALAAWLVAWLLLVSACSSSADGAGGDRVGDAGGDAASAVPSRPSSTVARPLAERTIGPAGGRLAIPGGVAIEVPPGALDAEVTITAAAIADVPPGLIGVAYRLGPHGTRFAAPVTISLPFAASEVEDPAQLVVATVTDGAWEILDNSYADAELGRAYGRTEHFSDFGLIVSVDVCGDGICFGEACHCPEDCGVTATGCGDGICCGAEDCGSCPSDCGACCGNGAIDERQGERCDGDRLGGASCRSLGFDGGSLSCSDDCRFDTSACEGCGNGVRESGEQCDGEDFGDATCGGAAPVACSDDCTLLCACGNGALDAGEECDPSAGAPASCEELGFTSGTTQCDACQLDDSDCSSACASVGGYYRVTGTGPYGQAVDSVEQVGQTDCHVTFPVPEGGAVEGTLDGDTMSDAGACDLSKTSDVPCCDVSFASSSATLSCIWHLFSCAQSNSCDSGETCSDDTCQAAATLDATRLPDCASDGDCGALEFCGGYCQACTARCTAGESCALGGEGGTGLCTGYGNGCSRCEPQ